MVDVLSSYANQSDQGKRLRRLLDLPLRRAENRVRTTRKVVRLRPPEVAELVAARAAGAEINELAERFGVHRATVMAILRRQGVPNRRRQGRTLNEAELQRAGERYDSGLSLLEVAAELNVDRRYLRRVLPDAGFRLRPPGRQPAGR